MSDVFNFEEVEDQVKLEDSVDMGNLINPPSDLKRDKRFETGIIGKNHIKYIVPANNKQMKKDIKTEKLYMADAIKKYPIMG
jgi:hypothetical protein